MGVNHGRNPQPQGRRKCQTTESDNTAVNIFYSPPKTFLKIFLESDLLFIYTEGQGHVLVRFLLNSYDNMRKTHFFRQIMSRQSPFEVDPC